MPIHLAFTLVAMVDERKKRSITMLGYERAHCRSLTPIKQLLTFELLKFKPVLGLKHELSGSPEQASSLSGRCRIGGI
jgi:hypothetical protein